MSAAAVLMVVAVLVWPARRPGRRLPVAVPRIGTGGPAGAQAAAAAGTDGTVRARRDRLRVVAAVAAGAAAVLCALTVGPATTMIVGLIALIAAQRLVRRRRTARATARTEAVIAAVDAVLGEVRAGAHPATACAVAGQDGGPGPVAEAFARAGATAVLGGTVSESLTDSAYRLPDLAAPAAAWRLAEQHGLGMAELLATVRADLASRRDHARRVDAGMAGARATAAVLAALPVLGIALGQLMGAAPLAVLFGGGLGSMAALIGIALIGLGLVWTDRITGRGAR